MKSRGEAGSSPAQFGRSVGVSEKGTSAALVYLAGQAALSSMGNSLYRPATEGEKRPLLTMTKREALKFREHMLKTYGMRHAMNSSGHEWFQFYKPGSDVSMTVSLLRGRCEVVCELHERRDDGRPEFPDYLGFDLKSLRDIDQCDLLLVDRDNLRVWVRGEFPWPPTRKTVADIKRLIESLGRLTPRARAVASDSSA